MIALDIISQARERLGDINEQRWTNKRLLNIVSQGQQDICKRTKYIRKSTYIPLANSESKFMLPSDCISIQAIEYRGDKVPIYSRNDKTIPSVPTTTPFVAIKSNLNMGSIELYPAVTDVEALAATEEKEMELTTIDIDTPFGVLASSKAEGNTSAIFMHPLFGVVSNASLVYLSDNPGLHGDISDYTYTRESRYAPAMNSKYGVTTSVSFEASKREDLFGFTVDVAGHEVSGHYGICSDVAFEEDMVKVFYISIPERLYSESAALELPDMWEDILMRYVVGTALQDDNDTNNIQRGEVELQKYTAQLMDIQSIASQDFATASSEQYSTTFRRV